MGGVMAILIHHNPKCGTSRNVLAAIRASGAEPHVNLYLETGWTRPQLLGMFAAAGMTVRDALRDNVAEAAGLLHADDDALIAAMLAHPILVNRPFVFSAKGVRLCRPPERVLELLEAPLPTDFVKEDGRPMAVPPR